MKYSFRLFAVLFIGVQLLFSCNPEEVIENSDSSSSSSSVTELSTDYDWVSDNEATITLNGSSIETNSSAVAISGTTATITQGGYYVITGTLTNGQIIVNADTAIVKIKLSSVNITNTSGSPFYIKKAGKAVVFLADNSTNSMTDASSYSYSGEPNATLFSNSYLSFTGTGSLTVKANYNDAISSDDEIIINNGVINVTAKDDGIRGKNYLIVNGGTITATATGGHALKSDNDTKAGYGMVKVNGGTLNLTSTAKDGIHAINRVLITGGTLNIAASASQGLKSDSLVCISGGNITISKSHEGIESPYIRIQGGNSYITASDDGVNATKGNGSENNDGSLLSIEGGYLVINATGGDGLDSNGNITMSGGTAIVNGPQSQPEVELDYNGTFNLTGGFLIASGVNSNMVQGVSSSSTQYSLKISTSSSLSSSTLLHIQDAAGNDVVTFKGLRNYSSVIFSSDALSKGSSYSIYTGGTYNGTLTDGIYTDGTYSGGTLKKTFTISSSITTISF